MQLGQFVVGQVQGRESGRAQALGDGGGVASALDLDAHEDVRLPGVGDPVIELRDIARPDRLAKAPEAAALLGDGDGEHGLALLADLGALGHESQPVEVHIGATGDRDQCLATDPFALDIGLGAGNRQRARGLEDRAGVLEDVLDRRAQLIGVDQDDLVDERLAQPEGLFAHLADRGAIGEQPDVGQFDPPARLQRTGHRIGVGGLHADDPDVGAHLLHIRGDARDQTAAADCREDGVDRRLVLAQDLHADRAVAGDHVGIVEGVDEGEFLLALQFQRVVVGVGVAVAEQHDFGATSAHRVDLQLRRGDRHHDHGPAAHAPGRQRDPLGMVAGRRRDHPARQLLGRQMRHLVVGAAQLEREHVLHILAFEQQAVAQPCGQQGRLFERGFARNVVDLRGQDAFQVLGGHTRRAPVRIRRRHSRARECPHDGRTGSSPGRSGAWRRC